MYHRSVCYFALLTLHLPGNLTPQKRFCTEKIALMGHSYGTALVQTHPEAFSFYIGVGQVTNLQDNEKLGYEETLKRAQAAGSAADMAALRGMGDYPGTVFSDRFCKQMLTLRRYQQKYKIAETISLKNILLVLSSPYYSFFESLYYTKDTVRLLQTLFQYLFEKYDPYKFGTDYQIPVYYVMGEQDVQTPVSLAQGCQRSKRKTEISKKATSHNTPQALRNNKAHPRSDRKNQSAFRRGYAS